MRVVQRRSPTLTPPHNAPLADVRLRDGVLPGAQRGQGEGAAAHAVTTGLQVFVPGCLGIIPLQPRSWTHRRAAACAVVRHAVLLHSGAVGVCGVLWLVSWATGAALGAAEGEGGETGEGVAHLRACELPQLQAQGRAVTWACGDLRGACRACCTHPTAPQTPTGDRGHASWALLWLLVGAAQQPSLAEQRALPTISPTAVSGKVMWVRLLALADS